MFLSRFYLLIFLSSVLAATDYESPNPNFDCSNTKFQFSYTSCSAEDRSQCCPIGTPCCAGGCCSQDSHCVGGGTSKEGCCPLTALDRCGVDLKVRHSRISMRQGRAERELTRNRISRLQLYARGAYRVPISVRSARNALQTVVALGQPGRRKHPGPK